ncbi:guanylate-binding protein 1-like [Branchiostoma floridae]|uniref:Guanylate-binding protein 1-like n=1 Tax=Branchiostoma floridae TaxID=7739 RepID=A0A9J7HR46_BRAFL|nr:guanylate-binding protein 1-like [Branchiostoma floridae]
MPGVHSKFGFKVEELKPKKGGKRVKGSSIPLILPNDLQYNASTGRVETVQGERRESAQIVPEALELLEGIEEPVSVISICGPCRTGKSYILSRLLGTADAFALGHRMSPHTFGIWMGTKVLRGKDFTIVLLDTEGIDAPGASAGQDASILVLTILLSSKLIYNSQNVPYKGDLEKMQCFVNLADEISVKRGKKSGVSAFREFFPDFLWLLRDVSLNMEDENGREMDPTEYLVTKDVGQAILASFSSIECATLERPSGDTTIMTNIAQHTNSLNPKFTKGVDELIESLLQKARAKRGYNKGSTVNGLALSIMTKQYVEAVNDPNSIPALDNTWKNTVEVMWGKAIEKAVMEYKHQMQDRVAKATGNGQVPLEETASDGTLFYSSQPTLIDLHNQQFEEVKDKLIRRVGHLGTSAEDLGHGNRTVVDRLEKRLIQREARTEYNAIRSDVTGGELLHFIQQNEETSKIFCQKLSERLLVTVRKRVDFPAKDYDYSELEMEVCRAQQQYKKKARGPQKWVVLQEMTKNCEQLKAEFKKIEEHHKKLMLARQKAKDAERRAKEREEQLQQLRQQAQDMSRAQREILQKLEEQHKKMMEEVQQEAQEQREQKFQELVVELVGEIMKQEMEELLSKLRELLLKCVLEAQQHELDVTRQELESLRKAIDDLPSTPSASSADDGCIIS